MYPPYKRTCSSQKKGSRDSFWSPIGHKLNRVPFHGRHACTALLRTYVSLLSIPTVAGRRAGAQAVELCAIGSLCVDSNAPVQ